MPKWLAFVLAAMLLLPSADIAYGVDASDELPWESTRRAVNLPGREITDAKQFLELLGLSPSFWKSLFHDQPLGPADEESIYRILYLIPRIDNADLYRWRVADWTIDQLENAPADYQGKVLELRGTTTRVQRIKLADEVAERFDLDHYYRTHVELSSGAKAIICTRRIPAAWTKELKDADSFEIASPVGVEGIFLKRSPQLEGSAEFVFAASRIAWLPDGRNPKLDPGGASHTLAAAGFDWSLLDDVATGQMRPLRSEDRTPFYYLLAAMQNVSTEDDAVANASPVDIAESIRQPASQMGKFVSVRGTVRRIDRIEVTDADAKARFQLDHYYSLYIFVPLENQRIAWKRSTDDKKPRIFEDQFPVTVCVPELPEGLAAGPEVHEPVAATGVFFKVWTYRPSGAGQDLAQPSPLVVARNVSLISKENVRSTTTNVFFTLLFCSLLAILFLVAWRMSRGDARFRREVVEKKVLKTDDVDLTKLG